MLLPACALGQNAAYRINNISIPGQDSVTATAIGNGGDILLCTAPPAATDWQTFVYHNGVAQTIPTPAGTRFSSRLVNGSRQIAGTLFAPPDSDSTFHAQAAVYANGTITPLPDPAGLSSGYTVPSGINASGDVVGWWHDGNGVYRAVLWKGGTPTLLDGGTSQASFAFGINDRGDVVGTMAVADGYSGHVLWHAGVMTPVTGVPGGIETPLLNNVGQVLVPTIVQVADGQWQDRCYVWDAGSVTEIPAMAIPLSGLFDVTGFNAQGVVIANVDRHAMVYRDGTFADLNSLIPADSGWDLTAAYGLNDLGQIVGIGLYNGQPAAFLLTPDVTVPEPSAAIAAVGVAGGMMRRHRRRG